MLLVHQANCEHRHLAVPDNVFSNAAPTGDAPALSDHGTAQQMKQRRSGPQLSENAERLADSS
jgi:hypothetical protein